MKSAKILKATETAQYLVDSSGRRTAVLIDISEYEKIIEDLHDLAIVAERRDEACISTESLKHRLGII